MVLVLCGPSLLIPANPLLSPQLLEVNKQWDQHFRSMKQQYEQKVAWELWEVKAEPRFLAVVSALTLMVTLTHPSLPLTPDH